MPVAGRALEISTGPDGKRYDVMETSDGNVTVKPWPFEEEKFTVNVEASYLNQIKFDDNAALKKALQQAPIQLLEWTFVKTNSC